MELERYLLRRERELLRGSPATSAESNSNGLSVNIKAVGELLRDFDGVEPAFTKWEQQVRLLCRTYELDDKAMKIIIVSHLKGKAQNWFYARPENVEKKHGRVIGSVEGHVPLSTG